jgi:hypothetical protein
MVGLAPPDEVVRFPSLVSVAKRRHFALGRKNLNGIGTWILL